MPNQPNLTRFVEAQKGICESALAEIKSGRKAGHWMWYIFPQIKGLGYSETSRHFAITDMVEATQYLNHPILGPRLLQISNELLSLKTNDSVKVFGSIDSVKLKSSMTLFSLLEDTHPIFQKVLDKFFNGQKDVNTIALVKV